MGASKDTYEVKELPNESEANGKEKEKNKQTEEVSDQNDVTDFDELLPYAGEFGRYQLVLFFMTMPFYIFGVFSYYTQMFLTEVSQQHWCWIPELENLTAIERKQLAIPPDENGRYDFSRCQSYVANWTDVLNTGQKPEPSWQTAACQNGWEFNTTDIPYPTISSELGWVCDRDSYQATAQAIFFVGSIVGGILIGWLADRYGRITGAVVSNIIGCIGGIATIFAKDMLEFSVCRFFSGFAYDNCMMMIYILVLEYTAPKHRTLMANMTFALFYSLGACTLPWIALICDNWKILSLATSIPMALALFTPLFIPESPRWLLSKGRVKEATEKLLYMGRINKKVIPLKLIEQFEYTASKKESYEKISKIEIFKRPVVRKMFIFICLQYICCCIVYDSLVRSVGQLDFNFFLSFTFVSFTELPSSLLVAFIMDWLGRRWLSAIFMAVSSLFCFCTAFIGGGLPAVLCAVIARFAVNMAYNAAMQWAVEILPTGVRASGASIVHICGYVATIISPYIVYLETVRPWLPLVVVGFLALVGVMTSLALPETSRREMPQTFDDSEELARSRKFWRMPCMDKTPEVKSEVEVKKPEGCYNDSFEG